MNYTEAVEICRESGYMMVSGNDTALLLLFVLLPISVVGFIVGWLGGEEI